MPRTRSERLASVAPPAISVLISAFNNARTLPRAIESILGQTVSDLELVVIDDGSADGSAEVAREAIGADPRGRVLAFEENSGIPRALNAGLAEVKAPWSPSRTPTIGLSRPA